MHICCPNITTPKRLGEVKENFAKNMNFVYGNKFMLEFPAKKEVVSGPGWGGGAMYLYLPWRVQGEKQIRKGLVASISFQGFTNNCGIRAITANSILVGSMGKLWFEIFEAYAYYLNYSVLVGSTGQQNGTSQLNYIKEYGIDWKIERPGQNRRISSPDQLSIYWKYLTEPKIQIPWDIEIPDAQQITDP